jgi:PAS domain S-box-containing protein
VTKNVRADGAAGTATKADHARAKTGDKAEFQLASVGLDAHWAGRILASDALFVTDEDQRIRTWSAGAQRVLGYSAEEVVGRRCYEVVMGRHPEGHPVCSAACHVTRNAGHGRGTAAYEVLSTGRDGAPRYLSTSVLVLEEKRGTFRVIHLMHESRETPPTRPGPAADPLGDGGETLALAEQLTRREIEVLRLLARGSSLEAVAEALSISVLTARNHASNIQHKLGVNNRLQMVLEGLRRGLV